MRIYPEAFTSSFDEECTRLPGWSVRRLTADPARPHDAVFGCFAHQALVGVVGLEGRYRVKERHNATVIGMVVHPQWQGEGIARQLMTVLMEFARQQPELVQIDLTVTQGNAPAQHLYELCGFVVYGVRPKAIRVDGQYFSKVLMALDVQRSEADLPCR
jgi:RimJ/RimL family protein N-acetyltransferase